MTHYHQEAEILLRPNEGINKTHFRAIILESDPVVGPDADESPALDINGDSRESIVYEPNHSLISDSPSFDGISRAATNSRELSQEPQITTACHVTFWLRRTTLIAFATLFAIFISGLEIVDQLSRKQNGFSQSSPAMRYLAGYGTTGMLAVTTAFWSCVEYRMLRLAPWIRSPPLIEDKNSLFLDYVDMWKVRVPYKALRNGDHQVAAMATISLLLNCITVLSTGLFTLRTVDLPDYPEVVSLQTGFVDDASRLQSNSLIPYHLMASFNPNMPGFMPFADSNPKYLNGLSNRHVYQSFTTNRPGARQLTVTVDGILTQLDCQEATIQESTHGFIASPLIQGFQTQSEFTPTIIQYEDCQVEIPYYWEGLTYSFDESEWTIHFLNHFGINGFARGRCQSDDIKARRLLIQSARLRVTLASDEYYENFTVTTEKAIALVCIPKYELTLVDVVWTTEGSPEISRHPSAPSRVLAHIDPWDITNAVNASFYTCGNLLGNTFVNHTEIHGDSHSLAIIVAECNNFCPNATSLVDTNSIREIFNDHYQKYSAALMYVSIMDQINTATEGVSKRSEERILVQSLSSRCMEIGLALCILITVMMVGWPVNRRSSSLDPGSIISVASLATRTSALAFPSRLGAINTEALANHFNDITTFETTSASTEATFLQNRSEQHEKSNVTRKTIIYHNPLILRPTWITMLLIVIACFIITLEFTLRKSIANHENGLGSAWEQLTYMHYAWTAFPAVILASVSTWISSIDSQIRIWAPYVLLGFNRQHGVTLCLDLQRSVSFMALYDEFRIRHFAALAITCSALLGSIFTTATASLFFTTTIPRSIPVDLWTTHTLTGVLLPSERIYLDGPGASLILESNFSYNNLAHENLVFPSFSLQGLTALNLSTSSDLSTVEISATVPALRPGLTCRQDTQSIIPSFLELYQNFTLNTNSSSTDRPQFKDCFQSVRHDNGIMVSVGSASEGRGPNDEACSMQLFGNDFVYAWGSVLEPFEATSNQTVWALGCNTTIEIVDAIIHFKGLDLALDESIPPMAIEETARNVARFPPYAGSDVFTMVNYQDMFTSHNSWDQLASLAPRESNTIMDPFFQQLITSRYAIPLEYLTDGSKISAVEKAILFQHSVITAQYFSEYFRASVGYENGTRIPNVTLFPALISIDDNANDTGIYQAIAMNLPGSECVFQDVGSTRLLQALLVLTFVLTLSGWLLGAYKPVLPRTPTSVASVLALLAGGNVLDHMYRDGKGDCLTLEEAMSRFDDSCQFRLGWGRGKNDEPDAPERFGIWIVHEVPTDIDLDDTSVDEELI